MSSIEQLRAEFPQLSEKVYNKPLVYLDNAATSLRPRSVIAKWVEMSSKYSSNLHRAVHAVANRATEEYENARIAVAGHINASSPKEIIFTSGTTHSLNLLSASLGQMPNFLRPGDEIIIAESEHHSNILPWQFLAERKGLTIKVLPVNKEGYLCTSELPKLISERTKLCCVAQVSNVLGIINPIRQIADYCHSKGVLLVVDGAQGLAHCKADVKALGADFYAFSGHKIYAAPGTGVLWGRKDLLDRMPPYMGGGEMIATVTWQKSSFADVPYRFEAGTQNMAGVPTLVEALAWVEKFKEFPETEGVKQYMLEALPKIEGLRLFGKPEKAEDKVPLFSFCIEGAHHEDLALILDKMGIAVRSGQMCAEPLMDRYGVSGMLRASFAPYNTIEEAEFFIKSLQKAVKMLK